MPIGATLASAAITAGSSIYGASKAAGTSKNALASQQAERDKVWGAVNPFMTAGQSALGQVSDPTQVMANFQASPDYQFRKDQALGAVTQDKSVNGLLRSGSALSAVAGRASDLAGGEFGQWWNRQTGLADYGLKGAQIGAGVAQDAARDIGNNGVNQANSQLSIANSFGKLGGSLVDVFAGKGGGSAPAVGGQSSYLPAGASDLFNGFA
jgi:hypothetical protein